VAPHMLRTASEDPCGKGPIPAIPDFVDRRVGRYSHHLALFLSPDLRE
jgi:hypothetical protein